MPILVRNWVWFSREQRFNSNWLRKNKKYANLSNDAIIPLRPGLKTDVKNYIFWCEIGSGFGELGGTRPPRIPRIPSPVYRLPLAVNGLDLITQPFYSYSPCNEETICHANCLINVWIKSYGVSIQRNFAQHYSGAGEFGKKKFDFFVNFVTWLLLGMKELSMYVCGVDLYNQ